VHPIPGQQEVRPVSELIDLHTTAQLLGLSIMSVRRAIYKRELPAAKLGGVYRIDRNDLAAYIDGHKTVHLPAVPA